MEFTKEQLSEVLCKHAERENGLQDLMEIMIESMMVAELIAAEWMYHPYHFEMYQS